MRVSPTRPQQRFTIDKTGEFLRVKKCTSQLKDWGHHVKLCSFEPQTSYIAPHCMFVTTERMPSSELLVGEPTTTLVAYGRPSRVVQPHIWNVCSSLITVRCWVWGFTDTLDAPGLPLRSQMQIAAETFDRSQSDLGGPHFKWKICRLTKHINKSIKGRPILVNSKSSNIGSHHACFFLKRDVALRSRCR